jgi:hypothetical protein
MLKKSLVTLVTTGVLAAAGAAHAAGSAYPASPSEAPASIGAERVMDRAGEMKRGAEQSVFPAAAREHGSDYAVDRAPVLRMTPSIAGRASAPFPVSVSEVL